jgi:hypothetical protein
MQQNELAGHLRRAATTIVLHQAARLFWLPDQALTLVQEHRHVPVYCLRTRNIQHCTLATTAAASITDPQGSPLDVVRTRRYS